MVSRPPARANGRRWGGADPGAQFAGHRAGRAGSPVSGCRGACVTSSDLTRAANGADLRQGRALPPKSSKHLRALPAATTIAELQRQIDAFLAYYNSVRPHRALRRRTLIEAFHGRPKVIPPPATRSPALPQILKRCKAFQGRLVTSAPSSRRRSKTNSVVVSAACTVAGGSVMRTRRCRRWNDGQAWGSSKTFRMVCHRSGDRGREMSGPGASRSVDWVLQT